MALLRCPLRQTPSYQVFDPHSPRDQRVRTALRNLRVTPLAGAVAGLQVAASYFAAVSLCRNRFAARITHHDEFDYASRFP
jgi:hypothetical protein